jgi:hypothetical protein
MRHTFLNIKSKWGLKIWHLKDLIKRCLRIHPNSDDDIPF